MGKEFGSALDEFIKDLPNTIELALEFVGADGVLKFQNAENIYGRTFGHRLEDGFSWATTKNKSGVGASAENSDHISTPLEEGSLNIGTNVPYATIHAYGMPGAGIPFEFGKNGNPSTREALVAKLEDWCSKRGIDPGAAPAIAQNIIDGKQDAYPYIQEVFTKIRSEAPTIFANIVRANIKPRSNEVNLDK